LDVYEKLADLKREFIKYCKPFEARLRKNVPSHRVIAQEEEQSTDIMIPGFIVDKTARGSKKLGPSKINLQFLQHHKDNYLELHHELAKISYSPQSDAALTNYKTLLELEISLLMGCDIEWGGASDFAEPAAAAAGAPDAVLVAAGSKDDDDDSSTEGGGVGAAAAAGPARPADDAGPPADPANPAASAAPAEGGPAAAPAASAGGDGARACGAGEVAAPDLQDFTTWTPESWDQIEFSQIHFPTDPFISICSVRSYHAVALLFVHNPSLRTAHSRVWGELNTAWSNTFHTDLSEAALEKWPSTGPPAFSAEQSDWLTQTLRHLKSLKPGPNLRRRVNPAAPASPAPAAAQAAPPRTSKKAQSRSGDDQVKKRQNPVQVQDTSR
jgi:hypothetical protein